MSKNKDKQSEISCVLALEKIYVPVPVIVPLTNNIPKDLVMTLKDAKQYVVTYLRDMADHIEGLNGKDKTEIVFGNNLTLINKLCKKKESEE